MRERRIKGRNRRSRDKCDRVVLLTSGVAEVHIDGTRQDLHDLARTSSGGRTMDTALTSASPDGGAIFLEEETSANGGQNCRRREWKAVTGNGRLTAGKTRIGRLGSDHRELSPRLCVTREAWQDQSRSEITFSTERPAAADATYIRGIPLRGSHPPPLAAPRRWSTA